ncbi:MAG: phosphoenolpyruvate hydrolase family protein [Planctomycetes bacterium]|nr:phosphoenolpyruvate hydrolase family protein [Planctomycetota bacterium]
MNRGKVLEAWRRKRAGGKPLAGGRSGPDFITVSNEDKLELRGARGIAGLLPLGDANALSLASVKERVPKADGIPVIAGVCATDPLRLMDKFLQEMKAAGAAGVQNAPSVGLIDGGFRTNLEEAKLGYAREVELLRLASKLDLITAAFTFTAEDARAMAEAGADLVVLHPGLGPKVSAKEIEERAAAAREGRKDVLLLVYGPADADPGALDGIQTE